MRATPSVSSRSRISSGRASGEDRRKGRIRGDQRRVLVFFLFYILMFAVCAAVVIGFGADTVTGFTAAIATLGNIGPGMSAVGPMSNFEHLHWVSKIVLTLAM